MASLPSDARKEASPSLLLVLKWGGELTPAGRVQAEELGRAFRCMYPGGQGETRCGGILWKVTRKGCTASELRGVNSRAITFDLSHLSCRSTGTFLLSCLDVQLWLSLGANELLVLSCSCWSCLCIHCSWNWVGGSHCSVGTQQSSLPAMPPFALLVSSPWTWAGMAMEEH